MVSPPTASSIENSSSAEVPTAAAQGGQSPAFWQQSGEERGHRRGRCGEGFRSRGQAPCHGRPPGVEVFRQVEEVCAIRSPVQDTGRHACLVDIGSLYKPQLAQRSAGHLTQPLPWRITPVPGSSDQIQTQLAQHSEYLVQSQSWLALLEGVDEARGHVGKRCKFVLSESQLKPSVPELIRPEHRMICSIVHTGKSTSPRSALPLAMCTIAHMAFAVGLSSVSLTIHMCDRAHCSVDADDGQVAVDVMPGHAPVGGAPVGEGHRYPVAAHVATSSLPTSRVTPRCTTCKPSGHDLLGGTALPAGATPSRRRR